MYIFTGKIGDKTCSINTDCSDAVAHSICSKGTCKCRRAYAVTKNSSVCFRRKYSTLYVL